MKHIDKITLVTAKALELLHWCAAACAALVFVGALAARDALRSFLEQGMPAFGGSLSAYGFEVAAGADGAVSMAAVALFCAGAAAILSLMAMVFRNLYLILRTAKGQTWFSKGCTPFQPDIIRMLREIGIFSVSVPLIGLGMSVLIRLIAGVDSVETSVNLSSFAMGLLVLCLTQFFTYGAALEQEVDGLL